MKPRGSIACLVLAAACATNSGSDECAAPETAPAALGAVLDRWTARERGVPSDTAAPRFERLVGPMMPTSSARGLVSGQAKYPLDAAATRFAAIPGALVTNIQCRAAGQTTISLPDIRTGDDGRFDFACPDTQPEGQGTVSLTGEFASIAVGDGPVASGAFGPGTDVVFSRASGRAFAAMAYVGPIARQRFGLSRPPIRIALDVPGIRGLAGRYVPAADRIEFGPATLGDSDVEEAFFQLAHEYGHAFHYAAIEPWTSYACNGGTHAFRVPNTLSCAFVEGFAHFFAAWIGGARLDFDEADVNYASDRVIEENLYRTFKGDGARTPGVVAAFLYDVADDAGSPDGPGNTADGDEPFDPISVPGSEIARLIRQCRLVPIAAACPVATALDGIDQFIYCAEGAPAPGLGSRWRSYHSVENGGGSAEWNLPAFRSLWQRDLFPTG